jgi:two-component system sensor histidine kinase YesM
MTLRVKLLISFLLVAALPINVISIIMFIISTGSIEDSFRQLASLYVSEITLSLDDFEGDYDLFTRSVLTDSDILDILGNDEPPTMEDMIDRQTKTKSLFVRLIETNPEVQGVILFSKNQFYSWCIEPDTINRVELLRQPWLINNTQDANSPFFVSEAHDRSYYTKNRENVMITVGRKIWNYRGAETGVILFDIYPDRLIKLSKEFLDLGTENGICLYIANREGKIVYDSNSITGKSVWDFGKKIEIQGGTGRKSESFTMMDSSTSGRLSAIVEIPLEKLFSKINMVRLVVIVLDVIFGLIITFFAVKYSLKIDLPIRKLRKDMLQARLQALQGQINPHMLYNTFESIRMKALINNQDEIAEMVKVLARMFKHSVYSGEQENLINDEIRYVKDYLYMQNIRYDNRFVFEERLSPAVLNTPIIPMVFQPIIENSIKHGIRNRSSLLHILVEGDFISAFFIGISITDDGIGSSEEKIREINMEKAGIGLKNLSERLRLWYGKDCGLKISSREGEFFKVEFMVPAGKSALNNGA